MLALRAQAVVMKAVSALPDSEIKATVTSVYDSSPQLTDTLMKYVCRCLGEGQNCGPLLKWHASIIAHGGQATVLRAMTDRKTA